MFQLPTSCTIYLFYNSIYYIITLDMFRAIPCSSSGGQIVWLQHLVSSLSVSSYSVHRLRADCNIYYYRINKLCIKLVIETRLNVGISKRRIVRFLCSTVYEEPLVSILNAVNSHFSQRTFRLKRCTLLCYKALC